MINEFVKKWSQFAGFKLVANVVSSTYRLIALHFPTWPQMAAQSRLTGTEWKDAPRKPLLPDLPGS